MLKTTKLKVRQEFLAFFSTRLVALFLCGYLFVSGCLTINTEQLE